jgi:uncharacterized RDD family membrane protein YckC
MDFEPAYSRYPLATINQRLGALIVDFLSCWFMAELILSLLSITTSSPLRLFTFICTWFVFRVFAAARGQGQSFGRWLMSIRVIDAEFGKTAGLGAFLKREIFVFACSLFLIETITSTFIVFAWIPFAADAAFAIVDEEKRQAFHDRFSRTISIQSRKGFQIDQKLGKLFNQAGQQANNFYQSRQNADEYSDRPASRKSKRRPRSKSRTPQSYADYSDFNSAPDYSPEAEPYIDPLASSNPRNRDDRDIYDDRDLMDTNLNDYRSSNNSNNNFDGDFNVEPPKRSARRPRRRNI